MCHRRLANRDVEVIHCESFTTRQRVRHRGATQSRCYVPVTADPPTDDPENPIRGLGPARSPTDPTCRPATRTAVTERKRSSDLSADHRKDAGPKPAGGRPSCSLRSLCGSRRGHIAVAAVPVRRNDAEVLDLTEQGRRVDAELLRRRSTVATVAAQGVGDVQRLE